jgi:hypothetical protein
VIGLFLWNANFVGAAFVVSSSSLANSPYRVMMLYLLWMVGFFIEMLIILDLILVEKQSQRKSKQK